MRKIGWLALLCALAFSPAEAQLAGRGQCYWKVMAGDALVSQHQQQHTALNAMTAAAITRPASAIWMWHDCVIDYTRAVVPAPEPEPEPDPDPPPPPSASYTDTINVGESIQSAVNNHPAGSSFLIRAGTHARQQVSPKDGNSFVGEPGAILDGQRATAHAFVGCTRDVTIRGLTIQNYNNPLQHGAIHGACGNAFPPANLSLNWLVENNLVTLNAGVGIRTGNRMVVRNNRIIRNEQLGIGGHGIGVLVEGNEIAWNNPNGTHDWGWEAGGSKFVRTDSLTLRGNWAHHNHGAGLWADIDNRWTLYEDNRVEDNFGPGIFHEISYNAIIRNNTILRNSVGNTNPFGAGAGIVVSASGCATAGASAPVPQVCVEVYGNTVEGNGGGIVAIQQDRNGNGSSAWAGDYEIAGPWTVRGLWVHDNTVQWSLGTHGVAVDVGGLRKHPNAFAASSNNRFDRNTYRTALGTPFEYNQGRRSWSYWRSTAGMDANGSLAP